MAAAALLALFCFPGPVAFAASPWTVPPPGSCQPEDGLKGWPPGQDAPPVPFQPGDAFDLEQLAALKDYFPPQLWAERERFFYEGMRLEIGPCFADYSPPGFFTDATEAFKGKASLLENGGLQGYTAGLPFAPDTIDPAEPRAGLEWAWNVATRYQAAGFRGRFRISDMVGREGRAEPFEGQIFKIQLAHRADQAANGYRDKAARSKHWVAGGEFFMPFDAREYAWRQYRDVEHLEEVDRSDDLHAYLPDWRRVRRLGASGIEGIFMPSFSVGVVKPATIAGFGAGGGSAGGAVSAAGAMGAGADAITTKRSGFEGMEIRPLLYDWEVKGVHDLLAPINAANPSYPELKDREYGPWGLSFASDRWDLRRALVIEGKTVNSRGATSVSRMILYVDLQTLAPIYYMSFDSRDEPIDVGQYVGRWSEDREDYPGWPDDPERPVRVIDTAGASFANLADIGGWRRETWDLVSTPPDGNQVRKLISVNNLTKGH
ncbi:MAG: DUF1329 domain-containing protein [Proteobacteria bacterium]|nr:DUF1329 domain-containing protein [Pseudomonadota bacterium]